MPCIYNVSLFRLKTIEFSSLRRLLTALIGLRQAIERHMRTQKQDELYVDIIFQAELWSNYFTRRNSHSNNTDVQSIDGSLDGQNTSDDEQNESFYNNMYNPNRGALIQDYLAGVALRF